MKKIKSELWVGTEASFEVAQSATLRMQSATADMKATINGSTEEAQTSPLLSIIGGVGIVQISGSLVNNNEGARWNSFFGVTSYSNIREALALAVGNPLVKHVLLDINSGGGAVSGVTDTAALIAQVNKSLKPVSTYSGGVMASGAYWLGVSGGKIYSSDVAIIGSIGVITSHMDYSAQLSQDGVKATVIRAGEFKQLNSPLEPLSDKGLAEIQASLDQVYSVFVQHVADSRSVSYSVADKQMAQGKEFVGQTAKSAGLVDDIETFDSVLAKLLSKVALDSNSSFSNTNLNSKIKAKNMTLSLNEQQIAVLAAGGEISAAEIAAATVADITAEDVTTIVATQVTATTEATAEAVTAEAVVETPEAVSVVTFLQSQLKEANASLLEATIALRDLKASSEAAINNEKALLAIACNSVNKMNIALGGSERNLSAMSAVAVLAEHEVVSVDFNSKFKVGGVAAAALNNVAETTKATVSPISQARLNAVKKGNK
jgi:signal peptide peptidase SppA